MDSGVLELGLVSGLDAESFGEPGQRTFRIRAETPDGRLSLWLEKEQVVMLGSAVQELLERLPDQYGSDPQIVEAQPLVGELEVRLGALALGYDGSADAFRFEASEFDSPLPLSNIVFLARRVQIAHIGDQIEEIVAGSRPRCQLCNMPLGEGPHFCPPSNGHAEFTRPN